MNTNTNRPTPDRIVEVVHCQACGSADPENVGWDALREGDGYTACCNERAIYPGKDMFGRPTRCDEDCSHS